MRVIRTTVTVTDKQQITVTLPSDITPGKHRIVVVIDKISLPIDMVTTKLPLILNSWEWKNWAPDSTFRREDIY